jgi:DNA recombination protein RmuC
MSLVPTLRAIAYGWQQEALAKNAQQVFDLGKKMYERIGTFAGHMSSVGGQISKTADAYNRAAASLEGRLLVTARQFNELDLVDKELPEVTTVDTSIIPFTKPELMPPPEEARVVDIAPADRLEDYGIDAGTERTNEWRTGS